LAGPRAVSVGREIRAIRRALDSIAEALSRLLPVLNAIPARDEILSKRRLRLSPERRATLKLQGQYMGHLRNLGPRQKVRVKALKATRGFAAAIQLAKKLGQG
jgi:hypothetical protein